MKGTRNNRSSSLRDKDRMKLNRRWTPRKKRERGERDLDAAERFCGKHFNRSFISLALAPALISSSLYRPASHPGSVCISNKTRFRATPIDPSNYICFHARWANEPWSPHLGTLLYRRYWTVKRSRRMFRNLLPPRTVNVQSKGKSGYPRTKEASVRLSHFGHPANLRDSILKQDWREGQYKKGMNVIHRNSLLVRSFSLSICVPENPISIVCFFLSHKIDTRIWEGW